MTEKRRLVVGFYFVLSGIKRRREDFMSFFGSLSMAFAYHLFVVGRREAFFTA